tara:strand:+ start:2024 stop:2179 length:156 start_codon:yes stop_codon:yes gene_type:complete
MRNWNLSETPHSSSEEGRVEQDKAGRREEASGQSEREEESTGKRITSQNTA